MVPFLKKIGLVLIVLFLSKFAFSIENPTISSRSNAMGGTGVTFRDITAAFNNQAGLAVLKNTSAIFAVEKRFSVANINQYAFGLACPTRSGTFSVTATQFGYTDYSEQKLGLGYGKRLFEQLDFGIQLDYFHRQISGYGSANAYTIELGIISSISKSVRVGAHVFNPIALKNNGELQTQLPQQLKVGISWQASKKVFLTTDFINDVKHNYALASGIEYKFSEHFYSRIGFRTDPQKYSFGTGYNLNNLKIDISVAYHTVLGINPQVSITYAFRKK